MMCSYRSDHVVLKLFLINKVHLELISHDIVVFPKLKMFLLNYPGQNNEITGQFQNFRKLYIIVCLNSLHLIFIPFSCTF